MVFLSDKKMHSDDETKGPFPPTFLSLGGCGKNLDNGAVRPLSLAPLSNRRFAAEESVQNSNKSDSRKFSSDCLPRYRFNSTFSARRVFLSLPLSLSLSLTIQPLK